MSRKKKKDQVENENLNSDIQKPEDVSSSTPEPEPTIEEPSDASGPVEEHAESVEPEARDEIGRDDSVQSESASPEIDEECEEPEDEDDEYEDVEDESETERKLKRSNRRNRIFLITIIILLLLLGSCTAMYQRKKATCSSDCTVKEEEVVELDPNQGQYASEEEIESHVKQIAMPGWVSFTIPANTTSISQGFELHNPTSNAWYEDTITINGIETETIIVGEDEVKIDHLLRIVGIKNTVKSIVSYDSALFKVELGSDNQFFIKGLRGFDGTQEIIVETANGDLVTLNVTSKAESYYMTFALYIEGEDGAEDELIYQSGLVEPGMYIQRMELLRSLKRGTYDAYVLCQPYKSDARTKTNNGVVKLTLYVA